MSPNTFLFVSGLPHITTTETRVTSSLMEISPAQFLKILWILCGRPVHFILGGLWEKFGCVLSIPPHHVQSLAHVRDLPGPHWVPILYDFLWGSSNEEPADVQGSSPGLGISPAYPARLQLDTVGLYWPGYTNFPATGLPTPRESIGEYFQSPGPPLDTDFFRSFVSDTSHYCFLSEPLLRCW